MAEVTYNTPAIYGSTGSRRSFSANASVANTNTVSTGFQSIDSFSITPSASGKTMGATIAGGVLTLSCSGSDTATLITVFGI